MNARMEPIDMERARAISPGEIECCSTCAAVRTRGADMTPLGWRDFHAGRHYGVTR